ncbi:MAG: ArsA family ATPase [Deltaproteobacteria bacterium]|nr:ArsA family ATPase [Deltaproteobacteria bacterium]
MRLSELLSKKLLVVSGKGGVGKTTVSLTLALMAAERGQKVLLAEMNSEEQVAHLLKRPAIGYQETELLPRLWGINIKPGEAFREYVLQQIRFERLFRAVFENHLVRHFVEGTPGLADLMSIGKISTLTSRYDLVIVDAPATGHTIALLQIASVVASAVRAGPLNTESAKIDQLLHDRKKTALLGVSLPEEMPVTETVEMSQWLMEKLKLELSLVFLNQHQVSLLTRDEWKQVASIPSSVLNRHHSAALQSEHYKKQLALSLPGTPVISIPFLFSAEFGLPEIETLAEEINRGLS